MDAGMGCGTTATERLGLENEGSSGFESLIVFVIIFTQAIQVSNSAKLIVIIKVN